MPTSADFPREWFTFPDPADGERELRCDLTWLMSSWGCIFGRGCPGIVEERPDDGCCSHGAFFSDKADQQRVRKAAKELTTDDWQYRKAGRDGGTTEEDDGRTRTRVVDGACVFLNRPGFTGGTGCALHRMALRTGRHPLETKPDVCWQVPISRSEEWVDRLDETRVLVTTITEFDRRSWGEGGHGLSWWCTESPLAHGAGVPVYLSYEGELVALIGRPAYDVLRAHCDARRATGLAAPHPATAAAVAVAAAASEGAPPAKVRRRARWAPRT